MFTSPVVNWLTVASGATTLYCTISRTLGCRAAMSNACGSHFARLEPVMARLPLTKYPNSVRYMSSGCPLGVLSACACASLFSAARRRPSEPIGALSLPGYL